MKINKIILIIAILSLIIVTQGFSQIRDFSQNYSTGLFIAPSFAGIYEKSRIGLRYRNQFPAIKDYNEIFSLQADTYSDKLRSGFGFTLVQDRICNGSLKYTELALLYAFDFKIFKKWNVRPGIQFEYLKQKFDMQNLIFGDMIVDGKDHFEIVPASTEIPITETINSVNMKSSVLLYSDKMWFGLTVGNLLRPNLSAKAHITNDSYRFLINSGFTFFSKKDTSAYKLKRVVISAIYKNHETFSKYMIASNFHFSPFEFGLAYKTINFNDLKNNINSISCLLGFRMQNFKIGYSFDFSVFHPFNSHEITLLYSFG